MLLNQFHQPVVDFFPHFVGGDGTERAGGYFNGEIELAPVSDINDHRFGTAVTSQEVSDFFHGLLGRG